AQQAYCHHTLSCRSQKQGAASGAAEGGTQFLKRCSQAGDVVKLGTAAAAGISTSGVTHCGSRTLPRRRSPLASFTAAMSATAGEHSKTAKPVGRLQHGHELWRLRRRAASWGVAFSESFESLRTAGSFKTPL